MRKWWTGSRICQIPGEVEKIYPCSPVVVNLRRRRTSNVRYIWDVFLYFLVTRVCELKGVYSHGRSCSYVVCLCVPVAKTTTLMMLRPWAVSTYRKKVETYCRVVLNWLALRCGRVAMNRFSISPSWMQEFIG